LINFHFAADTNATDVGDLTQARQNLAGQSSTTFGYTSGGFATPGKLIQLINFHLLQMAMLQMLEIYL
jgi:hypothetical protein